MDNAQLYLFYMSFRRKLGATSSYSVKFSSNKALPIKKNNNNTGNMLFRVSLKKKKDSKQHIGKMLLSRLKRHGKRLLALAWTQKELVTRL